MKRYYFSNIGDEFEKIDPKSNPMGIFFKSIGRQIKTAT